MLPPIRALTYLAFFLRGSSTVPCVSARRSLSPTHSTPPPPPLPPSFPLWQVVTAQYFVWYFFLLPLILPFSKLPWKGSGGMCVVLWLASQMHWLGWAYLLEFKGRNVYVELWMASLVFFGVNVFVLARIIANHTRTCQFAVKEKIT